MVRSRLIVLSAFVFATGARGITYEAWKAQVFTPTEVLEQRRL